MKLSKKYLSILSILLPFGLVIYVILNWKKTNQVMKGSLNFNLNDIYPMGITSIVNKNPLNIRDTNIKWQGAVGANKGFEVFDTIDNGIRAGIKNILAKGRLSIAQLLNILSPPSENATDSYIDFVVKKMKKDFSHIDRNSTLNNSREIWTFAYWLHVMEAGKEWIPLSDFERVYKKEIA